MAIPSIDSKTLIATLEFTTDVTADSKPVITDLTVPYQTDDGWWNFCVTFKYPVLGFGIHSLITGIDHISDFIYRGERLDVKPELAPPSFSDTYRFEDVQSAHCVNGWEYSDLQNTVQSRYFWVKLKPPASDTDTAPEISLREDDTQLRYADS